MTDDRKNAQQPDPQALVFLREVLVERGYTLPCEPGDANSEDLALYGKGVPHSFEELRQSFESLIRAQRISRESPADVCESLAIAARNGTHISDEVWKRMRADRDHAEAEGATRE